MGNKTTKHKGIFGLEHRLQKPISTLAFQKRLILYLGGAILIIAIALGIGILGYHFFEDFSWLDSFLNASMILGGMGPVNELKTNGGKLFAGMYALFSGLIFIAVAGILLAPLGHRMLHHFHFELDDDQK